MKKLLLLILAGSVTLAGAATISFEQDNLVQSMVAKSAGIDGLTGNSYNELDANKNYNVKVVSQGVVDTTIGFASFADNKNPTSTPIYPSGSIAWAHYTQDTSSDAYDFTISAGGNPGEWDPKNNYCLTVYVDGSNIGENCTNNTTYWSPTIVRVDKLSKDSNIKVVISAK